VSNKEKVIGPLKSDSNVRRTGSKEIKHWLLFAGIAKIDNCTKSERKIKEWNEDQTIKPNTRFLQRVFG